MKYLSNQFELVEISGPAPLLFGVLRADLRARGVWYTGRTSAGISLRMLFTDGALCTVLYRLMRFLKRIRLAPLAAGIYKLNALLTGAVIGRGACFGPGLVILHSQALVINSAVRGGENVVMEGCVTVGAEKEKSPVLGDNVFIGSGARIIGSVRVGDRARIGANAVVLEDVPDDTTAVGIPAKVVKIRDEAN